MANLYVQFDLSSACFTGSKSIIQLVARKAAGLGADFITELEFAFETIKEYPLGWPIIRNDFHRFVLPKFPFSVIYKLNSNSIYVVAIMHNSRKPDYWLNRK